MPNLCKVPTMVPAIFNVILIIWLLQCVLLERLLESSGLELCEDCLHLSKTSLHDSFITPLALPQTTAISMQPVDVRDQLAANQTQAMSMKKYVLTLVHVTQS